MDVICFEKYYNDNSDSVEFSIRYDKKPYSYDKEINGYVTLTHMEEATFPITQLDWIIGSLTKIRDEIKESDK